MTKHITVKLTVDQASEVIACLFSRIDELGSKADMAFVQRIINKVNKELVELAKAKNE